VVEHAGLELEEEERAAPAFAEYSEPRVTVSLEPRAGHAEAHAGGRTEERADARRKSEARTAAATATTAVEDRRQRVRAKVNYFACVRSEAFGKDVVSCIDMSRGGLGFRTKNAYLISTEVTIAVPFSQDSPNAPAIYVPARVVNISEIPELQMYRCGVAFLPVAGPRANTG
jgi:hypothetical protein